MADTNEEQLLDELLRKIGAADRSKPTPAVEALEARVLAGWDDAAGSGRTRIWKPVVVAGLAAALVMAIGGVWFSRDVPTPVIATQSMPAPSRVANAVAQSSIAESPVTQSSIAEMRRQPTHHHSPIPPIAQPAAFTPSPTTQSPMEFVPLMPLTEHELAGPFQLVRVQVPVASLGGLTSPLQHPGELVNADVLLGEDGVARGIRITADESNYPWRFR